MIYAIPLDKLALAGQLLSKVSVQGEDDCWLFNGYLNEAGYGQLHVGGKTGKKVGAHRASYEIFKGPLGDSHVLHSYDIPSCVNPKHLKAGTHAENMAECAKRQRNRAPREGNGVLKITPAASLEIARLADNGVNYTHIGRMFSITAPTARYHHRKHANAC